jgi:hypothetical protein
VLSYSVSTKPRARGSNIGAQVRNRKALGRQGKEIEGKRPVAVADGQKLPGSQKVASYLSQIFIESLARARDGHLR